jgi:hypothetical protein
MFQYISSVEIPNDNPDLGRESSVTLPLASMGEKTVVTGKPQKARADGFYTIGKSHFKMKKGKEVPANAEELFYDEPEPVVTASDVVSRRFAAAREDEVAADTGKPKGGLLSTSSLPDGIAADVVKPKAKATK